MKSFETASQKLSLLLDSLQFIRWVSASSSDLTIRETAQNLDNSWSICLAELLEEQKNED